MSYHANKQQGNEMKKTVALFRYINGNFDAVHDSDIESPDLIRISEEVEVDFPTLDIDENILVRAKLTEQRKELADKLMELDKALDAVGVES
jgi:hypothetical protein